MTKNKPKDSPEIQSNHLNQPSKSIERDYDVVSSYFWEQDQFTIQ